SLTIFAYRITEVGDGAQPFIGRILATESVVARASKTQRQRTSAYDMLYRPRRGERNSVVLMRCVQSRNHASHRAQAGTQHGQRHLRSGRTRAGSRTGSARSIVCCLLAFRTLFTTAIELIARTGCNGRSVRGWARGVYYWMMMTNKKSADTTTLYRSPN